MLLDLLTYIMLLNNQKLEGGPFGGIKKFSKKKSHSAEKIERGPFSLVRFCRIR